jgi:hypothetical protein
MLFWLAIAGFAATLVWAVWYVRRKAEERRLAEEARAAAFLTDFAAARKTAGAIPPVEAAPEAAPMPAAPIAPAPVDDIGLQKLLYEAAHKAGEAGEPALAIQLYSRLLARYPATHFSEAARAAVTALSRKALKS